MKALISILIVLIVGIVGFKLYERWNAAKEQRYLAERAASGADINPDTLEGMPWQLVPKMHEAEQAGPDALKRFIDSCKRYPDVKDPRLAWLELDYAVLISSKDPVEAKKIFQDVKKRTPPDSKIWPRINQLAKTYE